MSTRRSALSIAVIENHIYVIGGYDGNNSLSTMEKCVFNVQFIFTNMGVRFVFTCSYVCALAFLCNLCQWT